MQPGTDVFLPARYVLRILDAKNEAIPLLHFQTASPVPKYQPGDLMGTTTWPLGQKGHLARVARVVHKCWSIGDQVCFEQNVYCDFHLEPKAPREDRPL